MSLKHVMAVVVVTFMGAVFSGQTSQTNQPGQTGQPRRFQLPSDEPAATRPSLPTVGLYVHDVQVTDHDAVPIIVELSNVTDRPLIVNSVIFSDFKGILGNQELPVPGRVLPNNDKISLVFHLNFPYPQHGMPASRPPDFRKFRLAHDLKPEFTLEGGNSILNHIDLPPGFFVAGENTIEITLVQYGKDIGTSGIIQVHCAGVAQSQPAVERKVINWQPAATTTK